MNGGGGVGADGSGDGGTETERLNLSTILCKGIYMRIYARCELNNNNLFPVNSFEVFYDFFFQFDFHIL